MRFTKVFCALISWLALVASPVLAQPATGSNNDDAKLREALRQQLQTNGDGKVTAMPPREPIELPAAPRGYGYPFSNLFTTNITVVPLSLEQAIQLALEHNIDLQVSRYNPVIMEYERRALYGYYDPTLGGQWAKRHAEREAGGFNNNTGVSFPGTQTDTDLAAASLGGYLPTGARYDVNWGVNNVDATSHPQIGTNSFGQPIFGSRNLVRRGHAQSAVAAGFLDRWTTPRDQTQATRRVDQPTRSRVERHGHHEPRGEGVLRPGRFA
jgi:hypothetical protein